MKTFTIDIGSVQIEAKTEDEAMKIFKKECEDSHSRCLEVLHEHWVGDVTEEDSSAPMFPKKMDINQPVNSKHEAIQLAMDWQNWQADQSLSYGELAEWSARFVMLGRKFNLLDEFEENGIV